MEELIELLNKYNIELHWVDRAYKDGFDLAYEQEYMRDFRVAYLISKKFWFIQWLVKENKIDTQKFREKAKFLILSNSIKYYEFLIMELSIKKNPISFLISILK